MSTQLEALRRQRSVRPFLSSRGDERSPVVFASGKGGSGTSTLAALLAVGAAGEGLRVLLVDGSAGIGSLHLYLGTEAGRGWAALKEGASPEELLVAVAERLTLLPSGEATAASAVSAAERQALFRRLAPLFPAYDLVVVDGGSRVESVMAACAAGASRLVAVTTPDRVSLAATYALVKVALARMPDLSVAVLANRGGDGAGESIRAAAVRFLDRTVDAVGAIPDDECLRAGINAGMNLQDAATGSPAAAAIIEAGSRFVRGLRAGSAAGETLQLSRRSFP